MEQSELILPILNPVLAFKKVNLGITEFDSMALSSQSQLQ